VRAECDSRQVIFNGLLACFKKGDEDERLNSMLNTAN